MRIELTQKELRDIVCSHYNIPNVDGIEIVVEQPLSKTTTLVASIEKDDVADLLTDVKKSKKKSSGHSKHKKYTAPGKGVIPIPKNPKLDYTPYGQFIEDFIKSDKDFIIAPNEEGIQRSGLLYRYRTAAATFGYRKDISLYAPRSKNILIISRPGKSPHNYVITIDDTLPEYNPKAYIK